MDCGRGKSCLVLAHRIESGCPPNTILAITGAISKQTGIEPLQKNHPLRQPAKFWSSEKRNTIWLGLCKLRCSFANLLNALPWCFSQVPAIDYTRESVCNPSYLALFS